MKNLNNNDLKQIEGGGINWGLMAGITSIGSFIIGIIDGYLNPKRCN